MTSESLEEKLVLEAQNSEHRMKENAAKFGMTQVASRAKANNQT